MAIDPHDRPLVTPRRRGPAGAETRASWKTSEFLVFILLAIGIFAAAQHVGTDGNNAFTAQRAWLYVTILGSAYLVSRGLAKSGTRAHEEDDPRS